MGFQNIVDAGGLNGISLSITGMVIVFTVLVLVSLFIAWLPKALPVINEILPPGEHHHGAPMPSAAPKSAAAPSTADEEIIAAIGYAMHHHKGEK